MATETLEKTNTNTGGLTINSELLSPRNEAVLPSYVPPTAAAGAEAAIGSSTASLKAESERLRADRLAEQGVRRQNLDSIFAEILKTNKDISNAPNTIDRRDEDTARKEADRLTSEIEAEQLANRRRLEKIQKNNPGQMFRGAMEAEMQRIDRESVSKQADLAILQNSALRNYSTANAIADRQLELKLEPLKTKMENLRFFYEYNKDDFDKEDNRLYSEAVKSADREYEQALKSETDTKDMKMLLMKNGAPQSLMNAVLKAGNVDQIQRIPGVGKYLISESDRLDMLLKRAQISKINAEIGQETPAQQKKREADSAKIAQLPILKEKMDLITKIKDSSGLNSRVGPNVLSRKGVGFWGKVGKAATVVGIPGQLFGDLPDAFGAGQDFAASVQQLTNQDTLNELLQLKAAGGTLGAVSNKELDLLQKAASKINAWEKKNSDGIGLGVWNIDEKRFKAELDQVLSSTQRIYDDIYGEVGGNELDDYLNTVSETLLDPSSVYINSGYDIN